MRQLLLAGLGLLWPTVTAPALDGSTRAIYCGIEPDLVFAAAYALHDGTPLPRECHRMTVSPRLHVGTVMTKPFHAVMLDFGDTIVLYTP